MLLILILFYFAINITNITCADLMKCCETDEVLFRIPKADTVCTKITEVKEKGINFTINYGDIPIKNSAGENSTKTYEDFNIRANKEFVQNRNVYIEMVDGYIDEQGTYVYASQGEFVQYIYRSPPDYCIEKRLTVKGKIKLKYFIKYYPPVIYNKTYQTIGTCISAFFLLLTFIVYCLLKQLRNIQGLTLMAYVATLALLHTINAVILIGDSVIKPGISCAITHSLLYYLMISSFFWLNIISLDIWWTFRGIRKIREIHRKGQNRKFTWYIVFASGVPVFITIVLCIADYYKINYRPGFDSCFNNLRAKIYYQFYFVGVTTIVNIILFIMTIYNITQMRKDLSKYEERNNCKNKVRFYLCLRIASVMGVSWIFEFITGYWTNKLPEWLLYILNTYNSYIGLILFIAFVCKTSVVVMLSQRFNLDNRYTRKLNNNNSINASGVSKSTTSGKTRYSCEDADESEMDRL